AVDESVGVEEENGTDDSVKEIKISPAAARKTINKQKIVVELIKALQEGSNEADLTCVGGSKGTQISRPSKNVTYKMSLINKSVTGVFETKTVIFLPQNNGEEK
ncbi:MAG: Cas9 endonuclease PAM-interacting domain-containing protein, partial [Clostridia bacterium]